MTHQIRLALIVAAPLHLAGCAVDPMSEPISEPISGQTTELTATAFETALTRALRDGFVSNAEWTGQLQPLALQFPHTASSDANALVTLWADQPSAIAATAYASMRNVLHACGYGVPRTASEPLLPSHILIADNLTTPDADFEAVAAAAGVAPSATITVAVLDDGIAFNHPALAGHAVTQPGALRQFDFVDGDTTLPASDHGTAVASIAARGGQRVKILPLRIAINAGIPATLPFGQIVSDAIDTAAQQGCRVVNMSYVTNRASDVALIRAAMARHPDTLFVLSAGNGNTQLGGPGLEPDRFLPTMHVDNVIIVANANRDGTRFAAAFGGSNFGIPYVDVAMRGMDMPLAIASGSYGRSRGTSSAAPNVAAVAARVRLIDPSLTASEVKQLLVDTAQPHGAWTGLANAGGLVDQARAIRAAAGL